VSRYAHPAMKSRKTELAMIHFVNEELFSVLWIFFSLVMGCLVCLATAMLLDCGVLEEEVGERDAGTACFFANRATWAFRARDRPIPVLASSIRGEGWAGIRRSNTSRDEKSMGALKISPGRPNTSSRHTGRQSR
jgi:hypothetical protein